MLRPGTQQHNIEDPIASSWLRKGVSMDKLEQSSLLACLFNDLLQRGLSAEEIAADWAKLTPEQIIRKYETKPPIIEQKI